MLTSDANEASLGTRSVTTVEVYGLAAVAGSTCTRRPPRDAASISYLIATRVDQCGAIENGYSTRAERARTAGSRRARPVPRPGRSARS